MHSKYLNFGFLVVWIAVSLMLAWSAFGMGGVDFSVYYAAARVTLQNGNPYDYTQLAKEIVSVTEINNPYYYAPWFTWAILPFALLPYQVARVVWTINNVLLWFICMINLGGLVNWPVAGWKRWTAYTLATVLFAWTTWGFEQVGVVIFFLIIMALLAIERDKGNATGIWLALLLFKPNITALPVAVILIWLIRKKNWRPVIVTGLATISMLVASLVITPGWYHALLQPDKLTGLSYKFGDSGTVELIRFNTTLLDWLAAYKITGNWANLVYLTVVLVGLTVLTLTIIRSRSLIHTIAVALLITFAITPYALFYDYPALAITLFHANNVQYRNPFLTMGKAGLNILVISGLFIGNTISFRYWVVIAIALLMVFRHYAKPTERSDTD